MASLQRPLSPHAQIYRLPLTVVLSFSHRLTGILLALGMVLLVYVLAAVAAGPAAYETARGFLGSWFGQLVLFLWTYALYFHLCNGIRHLVWDAGYGFDLEVVEKSAYAAIGVAALLTVVTWGVVVLAGGN